MDAAVIAVLPGREAWDRKLRSWRHRPGIEQTWVSILNAAVVRNRMMGRGRVVPSDGDTAGCDRSGGNIVWSPIFHEDFRMRGGI